MTDGRVSRHWFTRGLVPEAALTLNPIDVAVFKALEDRVDSRGICYPGRDRIARETGSRPRTVATSIAKLTDLGIIEIVGRTKAGNSRYRLPIECPEPLAEIAARNAGADADAEIGTPPDVEIGTQTRAPARSRASSAGPRADFDIGTRRNRHTKGDRKGDTEGVDLPVDTHAHAREPAPTPSPGGSVAPQPHPRSKDGDADLRAEAAVWIRLAWHGIDPDPNLSDLASADHDVLAFERDEERGNAIARVRAGTIPADVLAAITDPGVRSVLRLNGVRFDDELPTPEAVARPARPVDAPSAASRWETAAAPPSQDDDPERMPSTSWDALTEAEASARDWVRWAHGEPEPDLSADDDEPARCAFCGQVLDEHPVWASCVCDRRAENFDCPELRAEIADLTRVEQNNPSPDLSQLAALGCDELTRERDVLEARVLLRLTSAEAIAADVVAALTTVSARAFLAANGYPQLDRAARE